MQIHVRMVIPWQEVRSQEVVGLNPRAVKGFSSCKFSVKVYLYNILVAKFVLNRWKCLMHQLCQIYTWQIYHKFQL